MLLTARVCLFLGNTAKQQLPRGVTGPESAPASVNSCTVFVACLLPSFDRWCGLHGVRERLRPGVELPPSKAARPAPCTSPSAPRV